MGYNINDEINKHKEAYKAAYIKGDKEAMKRAHEAAEAVRRSAGFSGGADGSKYIPINNNAGGYTGSGQNGNEGSLSAAGGSNAGSYSRDDLNAAKIEYERAYANGDKNAMNLAAAKGKAIRNSLGIKDDDGIFYINGQRYKRDGSKLMEHGGYFKDTGKEEWVHRGDKYDGKVFRYDNYSDSEKNAVRQYYDTGNGVKHGIYAKNGIYYDALSRQLSEDELYNIAKKNIDTKYIESMINGNIGNYHIETIREHQKNNGRVKSLEDSIKDKWQELYDEMKKRAEQGADNARKAARFNADRQIEKLSEDEKNIKAILAAQAQQAYARNMGRKRELDDHLEARGLTGGASESAKIALNTDYENAMSAIRDEYIKRIAESNSAKKEVEDRYTLSDLEISNNLNENLMKEYKDIWIQRYQDEEKKKLLEKEIKKEKEDEYSKLIGQYYENYQAEINRLMASDDPDKERKIAYLKIARNEKLQQINAAAKELEAYEYQVMKDERKYNLDLQKALWQKAHHERADATARIRAAKKRSGGGGIIGNEKPKAKGDESTVSLNPNKSSKKNQKK